MSLEPAQGYRHRRLHPANSERLVSLQTCRGLVLPTPISIASPPPSSVDYLIRRREDAGSAAGEEYPYRGYLLHHEQGRRKGIKRTTLAGCKCLSGVSCVKGQGEPFAFYNHSLPPPRAWLTALQPPVLGQAPDVRPLQHAWYRVLI